jgi:hypothetical protein
VTLADGLGWLAAALVLATFCMHNMVALRLTAMASNLAFIAYGASAGIDPVLMLHMLLLPLNAWRLTQARQPAFPTASGDPAAPRGPSGNDWPAHEPRAVARAAATARCLESRACPAPNPPAPTAKPRSAF